LPDVERDHHQAPAVWWSDPSQLAHGGDVVVDVLEHVRTDHGVKARVRELDRR
jgi:hypothetical protein